MVEFDSNLHIQSGLRPTNPSLIVQILTHKVCKDFPTCKSHKLLDFTCFHPIALPSDHAKFNPGTLPWLPHHIPASLAIGNTRLPPWWSCSLSIVRILVGWMWWNYISIYVRRKPNPSFVILVEMYAAAFVDLSVLRMLLKPEYLRGVGMKII